MVDKEMGKHFKTQTRLNLTHCSSNFKAQKKNFNPTPNDSNTTKIFQFDEGMGKTWGVQCKGVQCLVMTESKQIRISSLRSLIFAALPLEYKEVL
jgi:hypothetical protein